ncbi:MAG: hypothetical protein O7H41_09340 [Planctomycetota bacterium]|nr:hypothetical protein [Planctomycetota bacterium]
MSHALALLSLVITALAGDPSPAGAWSRAPDGAPDKRQASPAVGGGADGPGEEQSEEGGAVPDDEAEPGMDDPEGLDDLDDLDGIDPEGDDEAGGVRLRSFRGFGEMLFRSYLRDRREGFNDERLIFELQMEIDVDLTRGFSGYLRPRFLIDALDSELIRVEPLEAYVAVHREKWDALAGQFVENWGIADTFNPLDVMNRRDLGTDILDPERLGELGGRFRYFFDGGDVIGEPTVSLFVIPAFRRAEFPTEESRWSFSQPPFELNEDAGVTPRGEDRIFAAVRGQSTLSTSPANADLQLIAARGPEQFPLLDPRPQPSGVVELVPVYYGVWTLGGGLRAVPNADPWSQATLKTEVVYKSPYRTADEPNEVPDPYTQYVVGVDWLFPTVFDQQDQVTVTVEYLGEVGADDPASEFRPFRSDIVLRALWEANDFSRTSLELRGLVDVETAEFVAEAILERQLRFVHEDLKVRLGVQYFEPDRSEPGFFAFFPNNTNVSVALRYDF